MGEETASQKCLNFRLSRARDLDLDLGSGHTAHRHASLIDLYIYKPNFIEIEESFCGRTGGRTFVTHFIRSTGRSRPKNKNLLMSLRRALYKIAVS